MFNKLKKKKRWTKWELQKQIENIRKHQTEVTQMTNTIIELKNTLERFNSRLDGVEDWLVRSPKQSSKKEKKRILKNEVSLKDI